jgi:hypothetical protein
MKLKWLGRFAFLFLLGAILWGSYVWWHRREPQAQTEIFSGVTYGCDRLQTSAEGSGLVQWVRIDLTAPGIELYVTSLDPSAVKEGWQYRLRRIGDVLEKESLSVVINACLFTSDSGLIRMPGDLARGVETVVANHVVSHLWEHTYLLWFDDQLGPHLKPSKPPTAEELALALWGVGGQGVGLWEGKVGSGSSRTPDARTAVAIDANRKLLFMAAAEHISPRLLLEHLSKLGAKAGMLLDGGSSTSMAISEGAQGVRPGVLLGGWRPVATQLGVRARQLK